MSNPTPLECGLAGLEDIAADNADIDGSCTPTPEEARAILVHIKRQARLLDQINEESEGRRALLERVYRSVQTISDLQKRLTEGAG